MNPGISVLFATVKQLTKKLAEPPGENKRQGNYNLSEGNKSLTLKGLTVPTRLPQKAAGFGPDSAPTDHVGS